MSIEEKIQHWLNMKVVCVGTPSEEGVNAVTGSIWRSMEREVFGDDSQPLPVFASLEAAS